MLGMKLSPLLPAPTGKPWRMLPSTIYSFCNEDAMKHPIAVKDSFGTHKGLGCMLSAVEVRNVGANIKYHLQAASCAVYLDKLIFLDRNVSVNAQLKLFPANVARPVCFAAGHRSVTQCELRMFDAEIAS